MALIHLVPNWFLRFDIGLEILFAIVTFVVAYYSYKIYKLSDQEESRILSFAFLSISISYLIKAVVNLLIISDVDDKISNVSFANINTLQNVGAFANSAYIVLFTFGLVLLAYMTFKIRSLRALSLLLATNVFVIFLSQNWILSFYLLSSLLTIYISAHYYLEYIKKNNYKNLALFFAFIFLFFSGIIFIFSKVYYISYVIGHLLELGSYLIILLILISAIRKK